MFQICFWILTLTWGNDSTWRSYCSSAVKPPTSLGFVGKGIPSPTRNPASTCWVLENLHLIKQCFIFFYISGSVAILAQVQLFWVNPVYPVLGWPDRSSSASHAKWTSVTKLLLREWHVVWMPVPLPGGCTDGTVNPEPGRLMRGPFGPFTSWRW